MFHGVGFEASHPKPLKHKRWWNAVVGVLNNVWKFETGHPKFDALAA